MSKFKIGDKVKCVDEISHTNRPDFYPAVGTIGEVKEVIHGAIDVQWPSGAIDVQWPSGSTSMDDRWYIADRFVELVE